MHVDISDHNTEAYPKQFCTENTGNISFTLKSALGFHTTGILD